MVLIAELKRVVVSPGLPLRSTRSEKTSSVIWGSGVSGVISTVGVTPSVAVSSSVPVISTVGVTSSVAVSSSVPVISTVGVTSSVAVIASVGSGSGVEAGPAPDEISREGGVSGVASAGGAVGSAEALSVVAASSAVAALIVLERPYADSVWCSAQSQNQYARPRQRPQRSKAASTSARPTGAPSYHSRDTIFSAQESIGTKS